MEKLIRESDAEKVLREALTDSWETDYAVDRLKEIPAVEPYADAYELGLTRGQMMEREAIKMLDDNTLEPKIDKDYLIRLIQGAVYDGEDCRRLIEMVEPKQGEWIYGEHDVAMCDGYRCDKCGFFVPWDYEHKFIDFINDYHFCPNCGAMMKGADDE